MAAAAADQVKPKTAHCEFLGTGSHAGPDGQRLMAEVVTVSHRLQSMSLET